MASNLYFSPVNELLSRLLLLISDTINVANDVFIEKQSFQELARYVEKIKPMLLELKDKKVQNVSESMKFALGDLEGRLDEALKLMKEFSSGSHLQRFWKSKEIPSRVQRMTREIGECLDRFQLPTLELSLQTKEALISLRETMRNAEFKAAVGTEDISRKLEDAFREGHNNSQTVIALLLDIARVTGAPTSPGASISRSFVTTEIHELKKEKEDLEDRKRRVEANYLRQMIAFLYRSDMIPPSQSESPRSPGEDNPMSSFLCPITGKLMEDPVEISSGITVERSAIEDRFQQGIYTCPVHEVPLDPSHLQPNVTFRDAIKEWKERNMLNKISKAALKIQSDDKIEVKNSLFELCKLLGNVNNNTLDDEKGLVLQLTKLLSSDGEVDVRFTALKCLLFLAKMNTQNKVLIANEGGIVPTVEFLAADDVEVRNQALALLLELSRASQLCEIFGKVKKCIPQLVVLLSDENQSVKEKAEEVLENISGIHDNLTQMRKSNYFKPLVNKLLNGPIETKIHLARELALVELADYCKASVTQEGAIPALVQMLSESIVEVKLDALRALQNLSRLSENREHFLDNEVIEHVFSALEISTGVQSEVAADILAQLAVANKDSDTKFHPKLKILKKRGTINFILHLVKESGPSMKVHLLQILLGLATVKNATKVRRRMRDDGAIELLLTICSEQNTSLRVLALKLLHALTKDGHDLVQSLGENHVRSFVMALQRQDNEEKVAAAGILCSLPTSDSRITQILKQADVVHKVVDLLSNLDSSILSRNSVSNELVENVLGVLLHFTGDNSNLSVLAEFDVASLLVRFLSSGTALTKQRAATALGQLSQNTMQLSNPVIQTRTLFFFCCRSTVSNICSVHRKLCSARKSFCLVQANAITPLVRILGESDCCADEAALFALDTLLQEEIMENGIKAITEAQGWPPIVNLLNGGSPEAVEKALVVLEKISKRTEHRNLMGKTAVNDLIQLMQQGSNSIKKNAAKILGNLEEIPSQSSYF